MNWVDLNSTNQRLIGSVLQSQAETIPDNDFLVEDTTHLSFSEVNGRANACAHWFQQQGIARGDRIALMLDSSADYVVLTLAINKLGAIWVPVNIDYKGVWLQETLQDCRAKILVVQDHLLERVLRASPKIQLDATVIRGVSSEQTALGPTFQLDELLAASSKEPNVETLFYGDTAAILWTSGTTGKSKGVMQSHNVWLQTALNGAKNVGVAKGDSLYCCLPMYQSAAWVANIYRALVTGIPCAIDPRFSASDFWDRCRHYNSSMIFTLGAMHMFLWNAPRQESDADNPVRVASLIPCPAELEEPFRERFGIETIFQGYGQSEVMNFMARTPEKSWPPNALGEPQGNLEVSILDDEDQCAPIGEAGELCVRPRDPFSIFNGYFDNPEATLKAYRNLWYHSGDLAKQDADGNYYFVDRKADFIRYKGRNISSFAVEAAIRAHPDVAEVAAHGVESAELASEAELKAVVVKKPGTKVREVELAKFIDETAPYFFIPRYIEFVDSLPMTPTGRVQKFKLREKGVTQTTWDARSSGFKPTR